jgi:glucose/mannose-6-phosphate isomerase
VKNVKPKPQKSPLDDVEDIRRIDKSNMVQFSVEAPAHYREAARIAASIDVNYPKPDNIIVSGMGGSAIGGELLKDYTRNQASIPIEVSKDYALPAYAGKQSLVVIVSYSGDTEESLSAFLDAMKRKCMVYCISSGGSLLEQTERLNVPHVRVPAGMPPRAALPYLFVPQLVLLEKLGLVSGVSEGIAEAAHVLEKISRENLPEQPASACPAKSLASGINGTAPVIYGFGIFRGVAQRWKQQFNENAKVPAKWEVFSELNHNEVVGWEKAGALAKSFSTIFLRDQNEPVEVRSRIETTKLLMPRASKQFEVWSQGAGTLARMLSAVLVGDFTSVYLAVMRGVDPTPVQTIATLKKKLAETGTKEKILRELEKRKPVKS